MKEGINVGKTVRIAQKENVKNSQVNWHITGEGCYGVEVLIQVEGLPHKSVRKWDFGSTPMDEAISFYWYRQTLKMLKHYYQDPEQTDIIRIVTKTQTNDISKMCKEAVKTCFAI